MMWNHLLFIRLDVAIVEVIPKQSNPRAKDSKQAKLQFCNFAKKKKKKKKKKNLFII